MQWEMFTHTEASPDADAAAHTAPTPDTTAVALRVTAESSASAYSASAPHATADAYGLAATHSSASPLARCHSVAFGTRNRMRSGTRSDTQSFAVDHVTL
jgi:hypothetical protein